MPTAATETPVQLNVRAAGVLSGIAIMLLLVAPRTAPGVLGLLALLGFVAGGALQGVSMRWQPSLAAVLLLAFAGWGLLSTIWAGDRSEAVNKSVMLALFVVAAAWAQGALRHAPPDVQRRIGLVAVVAFAMCLVYLCLEEVSGHAIKRSVFVALPFTRPVGRQVAGDEADMTIAGYISNRNMAAVLLLLWPMLLLASVTLERARRMQAVLAMVALSAVAVLLSAHETSIIAAVVSALVFAVCLFRPKLGLSLVAAGWLMATLLVVPLAGWSAHSAGLQNASWLPYSARHRIVIWAYTAEQVWKRPLLGVGAASTKAIDAARGPRVDLMPGSIFQWRSGTHAHNVYLQTWYELGLIGAGLLCAAGLALLAALARLPKRVVPFAAATMTAAAVTGAFSWGMWQAWFLALFAVAAVVASFVASHVDLARQPVDGPAAGSVRR